MEGGGGGVYKRRACKMHVLCTRIRIRTRDTHPLMAKAVGSPGKAPINMTSFFGKGLLTHTHTQLRTRIGPESKSIYSGKT